MSKPTACVYCYNALLALSNPVGPKVLCPNHHASDWKPNSEAWTEANGELKPIVQTGFMRRKLARYLQNAMAVFGDTPQTPPTDVIEYIKAQANADEWKERTEQPSAKWENVGAPAPVFDKITLDGNTYTCPSGVSVTASHLVKLAHDLPVFDYDTHIVNMGIMPFNDISSVYDLMEHIDRIKNVDVAHPIIVNANGQIMDGWHRVMRALSDGRRFIPAKRFTELQKFG